MTDDERPVQRRRTARAIGALRDARGYTRRDLARESGLSYPYVSQIENGDREPSMKALAALAGALGVEVGELVSGAEADLWTTAPRFGATADRLPTGPPPGYGGPPGAMGAAFSNPTYRAVEKPRRRTSRPIDVDSAVEQAHRALSLLDPDERVEAVTRLVGMVVPEVVEEKLRERR